MPVQINPTMQSSTGDIDRVVSFYDSGDPMSFYSHANVPLMMTIMAIHPDDPESNVFSILSPTGQFNCAVRRSLSGRDKNSMHQHNNFEFMYILRGHMYQIVEASAISTYRTAAACSTATPCTTRSIPRIMSAFFSPFRWIW